MANVAEKEITHYRKAEYDVDPLFVDRWSPRAMSGEPVSEAELNCLFEAARWAPSSYNAQPWRFIYARRDSARWPVFVGLLDKFNHAWAPKAAALIVFVSKKINDASGAPSTTHSYDTGAAWENFALQGSLKGLVVHGMEGFDHERAARELKVPDDFKIEAMAAVGRPGSIDSLPPPLQKKEFPSDRKKLSEIAFDGAFPA
jgi:nitroreductase